MEGVEILFKGNAFPMTSFGQKQVSSRNVNYIILKCTKWPQIPLKYTETKENKISPCEKCFSKKLILKCLLSKIL